MLLAIYFGRIFTLCLLFQCIQSYSLPRYSSDAVGTDKNPRAASVCSTAEVWRVCILVMSGSICLLFADDAVFLTSLEFALEQFAADCDVLRVSVRGQSTLNGQNYVDPQTNYANIKHSTITYGMWLLNNSFQNYGHWYGTITASTVLGILSFRFWNLAAGGYFHSATRALVKSGHWCWEIRPG